MSERDISTTVFKDHSSAGGRDTNTHLTEDAVDLTSKSLLSKGNLSGHMALLSDSQAEFTKEIIDTLSERDLDNLLKVLGTEKVTQEKPTEISDTYYDYLTQTMQDCQICF